MNRYLLAGCAAVALAMGSGAANAQAKFEVKVGGDAFFEWGWVDQDLDSGLRSTEARNRFRFNLIPSAKADNGLEYGARIRVRADQTATGNAGRNTGYDKAYIFAQGGFGQVRLGLDATTNDDTIVSRPIDYLPFGLFDQALGFMGGGQTGGITGPFVGANITGGQLGSIYGQSMAWPTFGDASTRVKYFSPRLAGFQLGASYTPRNDDSGNSINRSKFTTAATAASAVNPSFQDLWEANVNYDNTFGAVKLKAQASYYGGSASDVAGASFKNLNAWQAGAQVGFAGFTVGGSVTDFGKAGLNKSSAAAFRFQDKATVYQLGAQYTAGPIVVGGGWMRGQDSGSTAIAGKRKLDVYEIGAAYTVAPGFGVGIRYDYFKADSDIPNTALGGSSDDKGSIVILHSTLAF
ncbi:porin [Azospirillum sp.]|uniref:porin n=1 Tax=Azospirillum sp. TaxID=34012 RepID=UPI003D75079D